MKIRNRNVEGLRFIVSASTAAFRHRKAASTETLLSRGRETDTEVSRCYFVHGKFIQNWPAMERLPHPPAIKGGWLNSLLTTKTHRWLRGIPPLILNLDARWKCVVVTFQPLYTWERPRLPLQWRLREPLRGSERA